METVILISVLSTLGVVIVVGAMVVAFRKLKDKVDSRDCESEFNTVHDKIEKCGDNNNRDLNSAIDQVYQDLSEFKGDFNNCIEETQRTIDSRCDKLYTECENQNAALRHQDGELLSEVHSLIDEVHRRITELDRSAGGDETQPNSTSSDLLA
tara:strand:+ start:3277 stop:3735 length:459 start_codon:yes stop_codon:yes gene_type:complete